MCRICVATTTKPRAVLPEEKELRSEIADDVLRYIYQDIERMKLHQPEIDTAQIARLGNALTHVIVNGLEEAPYPCSTIQAIEKELG